MPATPNSSNNSSKRVPHPAYAVAVTVPPALLQGMPLDWAKSQVLSRAGVPFRDPDDSMREHPLRAGLVFTHATSAGRAVRRVPDELPTGDHPPATLGGWLALLDANAVLVMEGKDPATGRPLTSVVPDPVLAETVMVEVPAEGDAPPVNLSPIGDKPAEPPVAAPVVEEAPAVQASVIQERAGAVAAVGEAPASVVGVT